MRYMNRTDVKSAIEPNHSALQHAGLAVVLVLVILVSLVEMARTAMSRASTMPDIVRID